MKKVELFEQIRKSYFIERKGIREVAKLYGIHRRQVRQAIECAIPPDRKLRVGPCKVLLPNLREVIIEWLKTDLKAPRKQRHTGKRIYERLVTEHAYVGKEVTVRNYVYEMRRELFIPPQVFVPQVHLPGEEAEVDWYEAMVEFPHGQEKVFIFQMRACYSGKEFHLAFFHQNQQAFLEGHIAALQYFNGVFKVIRYDNLGSAIRKVLRGRKRLETDRFIAFRSHYLFQAIFCLPGLQGAHEKGGVECGGGRFRRTHLVPVPKVAGLAELNQLILAACQHDNKRIIIGKTETIITHWQEEATKLSSLPAEPFSVTDIVTAKVNTKSLVTARGNYYSVPVNYVGQTVEVNLYAEVVIIIKQSKAIAEHKRCYTQHQIVATLAHYLPLLKYKPGALPGSVALQQARQKWPAIMEEYWQTLITKYGQHDANRQLVDLLLWSQDFESDQVVALITKAMTIGCYQAEGIQALMRQQNAPVTAEPLAQKLLGNLIQYDRPKSTVTNYNQLLTIGGQK